MNLTSKIELLKRRHNLFTYIPRIEIPPMTNINVYPHWVHEYREWGIFGTTTDYFIRRLFRPYHWVYTERPLMARVGLYGYYLKDGKTWIENYKDLSKDWREVLYDMYCMSYLEKVARNNEVLEIKAAEEEVNKSIPFFENVENLITSTFNKKFRPYLNPVLGNHKISADADLILGSQLYEIKTIIHPEDLKNHLLQLFGYVALHRYNKENDRYYSFDNVTITHVGFILPVQNQILSWYIGEWDESALGVLILEE